jgi:hypothetical protein
VKTKAYPFEANWPAPTVAALVLPTASVLPSGLSDTGQPKLLVLPGPRSSCVGAGPHVPAPHAPAANGLKV